MVLSAIPPPATSSLRMTRSEELSSLGLASWFVCYCCGHHNDAGISSPLRACAYGSSRLCHLRSVLRGDSSMGQGLTISRSEALVSRTGESTVLYRPWAGVLYGDWLSGSGVTGVLSPFAFLESIDGVCTWYCTNFLAWTFITTLPVSRRKTG